MYYTAGCKDHLSCIAACETFDDPFNWYDRGPVLTREKSLGRTGETESPHVIHKPRFKKYYLFFNHGPGIKCVWSDDPLQFNGSKEILFLKDCNGFEYLGESARHEYFAYFDGTGTFQIGELHWQDEETAVLRRARDGGPETICRRDDAAAGAMRASPLNNPESRNVSPSASERGAGFLDGGKR